MKIIVLNGSPKGNDGVTIHYVKYIEKKYPKNEFIYLNVAQNIKKLENDLLEFNKIIDTIKSSDGVIWAFPVYIQLVPSNLKRFIELIWERGVEDAFVDKYTTSIATSIHFYDHTAIEYINSICDDLNMRYTDFFSADTNDLTKEVARNNLLIFAENFFESIKNKSSTLKTYMPIKYPKNEYIPSDVGLVIPQKGQKIIVVTDSIDQNKNLGKMVEHFRKITEADIIDISSIDIKGGCTGCIKCTFDNHCIYKDDIEKAYEGINEYDIIVFAGTIIDRYISARWKMFIDRKFYRNHRPLLVGKQMGYIISGPFSQIHYLKELFQSGAEMDKSNLVGVLTDEYNSSKDIDKKIEDFARALIENSVKHYLKPQTFLGIGGYKVFRDAIWGRIRFVFQEDHKYYKKHGIYDFPQNDYKTRFVNFIMITLTKIPKIKGDMQRDMRKNILRPYQEVLKKTN